MKPGARRLKYKPVPPIQMAPSPKAIASAFVGIFRTEIEKAIGEGRFPAMTLPAKPPREGAG